MKKRIKSKIRKAKHVALALPLVGLVSICMMAATLLGDYAEEQPLNRL